MREEYDFSNAVRTNHAERMRKYGYTTTVNHRDGSKTVTRYPPVKELPTRAAGKQFLIEQLRMFDLKVQEPGKKNGIDFIVEASEIAAKQGTCPVTVRSSKAERIHIRKEDENIANLLVAFVWHAKANKRQMYAVPFAELLKFFRKRRYTNTHSYKDLGGYSVPSPDGELRSFMEEHRITSAEQWLAQMRAAMQAY